jgi:hypothetical protein
MSKLTNFSTGSVSNSLFLLEPCPIAAHISKEWLKRLSKQQLTFEYFSTSTRDSFLSWCNIKASVDAGYGSDSSDSDVLSCSSNSSITLSNIRTPSRSLKSSEASKRILSVSLLKRPKSAVARLLHTTLSGRRAITSASGKIQVPIRARTADGYIHGIGSILDGTEHVEPPTYSLSKNEEKNEDSGDMSESSISRPLTVSEFLETRTKGEALVQLQIEQISAETEHGLDIPAEVTQDINQETNFARNATSRWDDAVHEAALMHPSNHEWMDRNIRFALVGNNNDFAVEREIFKRDCVPRMKETMMQLGYSLEMVTSSVSL